MALFYQSVIPLLSVFILIDVSTGFQPRDEHVTPSKACYPVVGCFSNTAPFDNAYGELPASPEYIGTIFYLYTQKNLDVPQVLKFTQAESVASSHYKSDLPTKIIIHGFAWGALTGFVPLMRQAILSTKEDVNVIAVGWKNGAKLPNYPLAVANTRLVGAQVAILIRMLQQVGTSLDKIHIIGHSLGAHIAGYAGKALHGKVGRISGLDPAGPMYEGDDTSVRLDSSDAGFVDVIHSNGAPTYRGGAGMLDISGHIDFYPNGGIKQTGCADNVKGSISQLWKFNATGAVDVVSCSHSRSHDLYIESITSSCQFTAYSCDNMELFNQGKCMDCPEEGCNVMGYHADPRKARGKLYLKTLGSIPYCGYAYKVSVTLSGESQDTKGTIYVTIAGGHGRTEELQLTSIDAELNSGDVITGVLYSAVELKDVTRTEVIYIRKHASFFSWSSGTSTLKVAHVAVDLGDGQRMFNFNTFFEEDRDDTHQTLVSDQSDESTLIGG